MNFSLRFKKITAYVLLLSYGLISCPLYATDEQVPHEPTIYSALAHSYLASFPPIEEVKEKKAFADTSILNPFPKLNLTVNLAPNEQRKLAFEILDLNEKKYQKNDVLSTGLWENLELYCGTHKKENHLFNKLQRTETVTGEIALARMIAEPTSDIAELKKRQAIIKELVTNKAVFDRLDSQVKRFKEGEQALLAYWKEVSEIAAQFCKNQYSQIPGLMYLNKNATYLGATTRLAQAQNTLTMGISLAMIPISLFFVRNPDGSVNVPLFAYWVFLGTFGANMIFQLEKMNHSIRTSFQESLIDLSLCADSMKKVVNLVRSNSLLRDNVESVKPLWSFSCQPEKHAQDLKELLRLLDTNTFKGEASFFSSAGNILAAQRIMTEVKEQFVDAYKAFGEIDAYLSIAKLYKEHQETRAPYCFVEYKEASAPCIALEGFWNPMVHHSIVVTNALTLGMEGAKNSNVILTGPNAGGKSTVLKALIVNIMLGQSFGIAPARSFVLTPFRKINTYLNITDDLAAGNSLFKAEVLRAQALIKTISSLKKGEFCFTVMDEVFSGTSPIEGEAAAYSVAKYLVQFPQSMSVVATHFPKLTNLPKVTNGTYVNKRVSVVKNSDGTLTYPYKLEDGKTSQNVALDILRLEGFESDILTDAYAMVKEHEEASAAAAAA